MAGQLCCVATVCGLGRCANSARLGVQVPVGAVGVLLAALCYWLWLSNCAALRLYAGLGATLIRRGWACSCLLGRLGFYLRRFAIGYGWQLCRVATGCGLGRCANSARLGVQLPVEAAGVWLAALCYWAMIGQLRRVATGCGLGRCANLARLSVLVPVGAVGVLLAALRHCDTTNTH